MDLIVYGLVGWIIQHHAAQLGGRLGLTVATVIMAVVPACLLGWCMVTSALAAGVDDRHAQIFFSNYWVLGCVYAAHVLVERTQRQRQ